jgi:hypothetical protein
MRTWFRATVLLALFAASWEEQRATPGPTPNHAVAFVVTSHDQSRNEPATTAPTKPADCVDNATFADATGYACSAWEQFSCISQAGYTAEQLHDVRINCPKACGQCRGGTNQIRMSVLPACTCFMAGAIIHRHLGVCLKSEAFPSLGGPDCPRACPWGQSSFSYKLFGIPYAYQLDPPAHNSSNRG